MVAIWHLCLDLSGGGYVGSRVAVGLLELLPLVHVPEEGPTAVFTFGGVPSFCLMDPTLLGSLLLLEFCLLLPIWPDAVAMTSEEDIGVQYQL